MKPITPKEYDRMTQKASPSSPSLKNCLLAFVTGGAICVLGQFLCETYQQWGLSLQNARCGVSVTLIFCAALLTAFGWFDNIARFAGAGTLVPITGFANAMSSASIEYKTEGLIFGTSVKMFTIVGPVVVNGVVWSTLMGLVHLLLFGMY